MAKDTETEPTPELSSGGDTEVQETQDGEVQEQVEEEAPEVAEEIIEDEPGEVEEGQDEGDEAPAIVAEVMPALAATWSSMSAEARRAAEETVANLLDDGQEPDAAGTVVPTEPQRVEANRPAPAPERAPEPSPLVAKSLITDEEWQELELESPTAAAILRKLDQRAGAALQEAAKTGELTLRAIESHDAVLSGVREEGELKKALDTHAKDLRRLDQASYTNACRMATEMKSKRGLTWSEAIGLAVLKTRGAAAKPGAAPSELQKRARQVASSLASNRGTRRTGKDRPPPGASLRDIFAYRAKQLGVQ